jgi:hypothetical protein
MKLKMLFLTLFVAGVAASMAVAKPPPGKGNPHGRGGNDSSTVAASTTSSDPSSLPASGKVVLCHHTGSKSHPWVKISVNVHAAKARMKKGDTLAAADGSCGSSAGTTTTGTTTTDTTGTTTTVDTTTVATTTVGTTTSTTP